MLTLVIILSGLQSTSLAAPPKPPSCIARAVQNFAANRKASFQTFVTEVRDTKGLRLLIKKRDRNRKRNTLTHINDFIFNPVATLFNRPREVTLGVSLVGYGVFELGLEQLTEHFNDQHFNQAQLLASKKNVPGAAFALGLASEGIIDRVDAAKEVKGHTKKLSDWLNSPFHPSQLIPRVQDLVTANLLSSSELPQFDALMRKVFAETRDAGEAPFSDALLARWKAALKESPVFSKKPAMDQEILSTAFWPSIRVNGKSDIELALTLFNENPAPNIKRINALLEQQEISIGEAYFMTSQTLKEKKAPQASLRPDIPRFSAPQEYDELKINWKNEKDRWEFLSRDPRFENLKKAWSEKKVSETQVLETLQTSVKALEELLELDQKYSGRPLPAEVLKKLYGSEASGPGNPLFAFARKQAFLPENASPAQVAACVSGLAELIRKSHVEEAQWIHQKISYDQFTKKRMSAQKERESQFSAALLKCQE